MGITRKKNWKAPSASQSVEHYKFLQRKNINDKTFILKGLGIAEEITEDTQKALLEFKKKNPPKIK